MESDVVAGQSLSFRGKRTEKKGIWKTVLIISYRNEANRTRSGSVTSAHFLLLSVSV